MSWEGGFGKKIVLYLNFVAAEPVFSRVNKKKQVRYPKLRVTRHIFVHDSHFAITNKHPREGKQ